MRSVADLIAADLPLRWHEAVAVVQEIAAHVADSGAIPIADDLLLAEDGAISFAFASEDSTPPVMALDALPPDDAPAALKEFAAENGREYPTHPTAMKASGSAPFFVPAARDHRRRTLRGPRSGVADGELSS